MKKMILVLLLVALPIISWAGELKLVKGKGVEVCEAYKKNLESFNEPKPMACERKINPMFKDFEKPVWEKVDLEEHRELFRRLLKYSHGSGFQFGKWNLGYDADVDNFIKEHKEGGYPFISRTKFALTPYGKEPDDVLLYRENPCPDGPPFHASNLYVLIEDPSVKDAMIYEHSLEELLRTQISPNAGTDTSVGLFRYKSVPYIDKYCISKQPGCTAKDTLIVFKYGTIPNPKPKYPRHKFNLAFQKISEYQYTHK